MNKPFAKLFDTPQGQLLAFLEHDDNGQLRIKILGAPVGNLNPSISFEYKDSEAAEQVFNGIDQKKAEDNASQLRATAMMILRENVGKEE